MRRPSTSLVPLLALAALLLAPRPARACTPHDGASTAGAATSTTAPAPVDVRATNAQTESPAECCAGPGGCDAPMPCCVAPPGAIPPVLAPAHRPVEPVVVRQRAAAASLLAAPRRAALAPEPPPPRA